jgi:hypothetical protein
MKTSSGRKLISFYPAGASLETAGTRTRILGTGGGAARFEVDQVLGLASFSPSPVDLLPFSHSPVFAFVPDRT